MECSQDVSGRERWDKDWEMSTGRIQAWVPVGTWACAWWKRCPPPVRLTYPCSALFLFCWSKFALSLFKSRTLFFFFVSPSFPLLRESPAQVLYLATVSLMDRKTLALEGAISISISGSRLITMLRNRITSLIRRSLHLSTFVPKGAHFLVLKSEYVCHSQKFHLQCSSTAIEAINSHRMHVDYLYGGFAR